MALLSGYLFSLSLLQMGHDNVASLLLQYAYVCIIVGIICMHYSMHMYALL